MVPVQHISYRIKRHNVLIYLRVSTEDYDPKGKRSISEGGSAALCGKTELKVFKGIDKQVPCFPLLPVHPLHLTEQISLHPITGGSWPCFNAFLSILLLSARTTFTVKSNE